MKVCARNPSRSLSWCLICGTATCAGLHDMTGGWPRTYMVVATTYAEQGHATGWEEPRDPGVPRGSGSSLVG